MKVVVAALSAPEHLNGVSRHAANVVRGLLTSSEISEVHLLVGSWQQQTYTEAIARQDSRLHVHPVTIRRETVFRNLWYYAELPRVAEQLNADVVHLSYPMPASAKDFRCPIVTSLHDLYPFDIPKNFGFAKSILNRQVLRQCLRAVDAIACVSESTRQRLGHWFGSSFTEKAVTILNAVDPGCVGSTRGPQPLHRGQPFLLCVAQHRRNKNIPLALKVFDEALRTSAINPETQLVVVGVTGPETDRIRKQVELTRLDRRVILLSGIRDTELQWCYRNCELLLAPSLLEGFGLPVVEALMAGCCVVCSDIPAFREVGGDACHYVPLGQDEVADFVGAIRKARRLPRLLPASMPWFSASEVAEKYVILYRRLQTSTDSQRFGALSVPQIRSREGM